MLSRGSTISTVILQGQVQVEHGDVRRARLDDFRTFRFLGEIVHRGVYLLVDLDKGKVRIGAELERQADDTRPVPRFAMDVLQGGNLNQLAAQRFHNRVFQFAGGGIRGGNLYGNLRNGDIRKQRYRQCGISHQANYKTGGERHQHGDRTPE